MMKTVILTFMAVQLSYTQIDKSGLVPDIIDKYPQSILTVTYKGNVTAQQGNELKPENVSSPPTVKWEASPNYYYLLIMTDPDATSRAHPVLREWLHWIVGNIPGGNLSKGEVLAEYIGCAPPPGMGFHRYAFLLYEQPDKIDFSNYIKLTNRSAVGREKFTTRSFIKKYNLGELIAINTFNSQYDWYVPQMYKKLNYKLNRIVNLHKQNSKVI